MARYNFIGAPFASPFIHPFVNKIYHPLDDIQLTWLFFLTIEKCYANTIISELLGIIMRMTFFPKQLKDRFKTLSVKNRDRISFDIPTSRRWFRDQTQSLSIIKSHVIRTGKQRAFIQLFLCVIQGGARTRSRDR